MSASLRFRWLGVAGLELTVNGQSLAIDPFFTRPPMWRIGLGRVRPNAALAVEKVPRCDAILVTHAHWDHLMDVPAIALHSGATVHGSPNTGRILAQSGLPPDRIRPIAAGDRLTLGQFRVEVLPATHPPVPGFGPGPLPATLRAPLRLRDYRMDCCFSYYLEARGLRLLDWRSDGAEGARPADVLWLGPAHRPAHYAPLLAAVRPALVILVHWDDLFRPLARPLRPFFGPPRWDWPPLTRMDPAALARAIERLAPETRVLVPEVFLPYDLSALVASTHGESLGDPSC